MSSPYNDPDQDPALSLTTFLRSSAIMHPQTHPSDDPQNPAPQPHDVLATLIDDERWTRRMLEDWFKQGTMRDRGGSVTPNPELRAVYLVILDRMLKREKEFLAKEKIAGAEGEEKDDGAAAAGGGKVEGNEENIVDIAKNGIEKTE